MKTDAAKTLENALTQAPMKTFLDDLAAHKDAQALQTGLRSGSSIGIKTEAFRASAELRLGQHLQSGHSKSAADKLDQLCSPKAPKGMIREGDALKQEQAIEKAKLKQGQFGESKKLYGKQEDEKKAFNAHQSEVKAKFLAKKPSADQIATFNKVQTADKKAFEAGQVKENVALYNKHQGENQALLAQHAKQAKELEAKNNPPTKPVAKPTAPKAAAKPVAIVEIPAQDCGPKCANDSLATGIPVAKIDGTTDGLVYIPA